MKSHIIAVLILFSFFHLTAQQRLKGIAISIDLPDGWQIVDEQYGNVLLGHSTIPGLILLTEHGWKGNVMIRTNLSRGVTEEAIQLNPFQGVKQLENGNFLSRMEGYAQGQAATAIAVVTKSSVWQTGGIMIMAMVSKSLFNESYQQLVIDLASSIKYHRFMDVQAQQWATLVKGKKLVHRTSYSTGDTFTDQDGSFAGSSSLSMSERQEVHLCSNGRFVIFNHSNSSISAGGDAFGSFGMGDTNESNSKSEGLWSLLNIQNTPVFRLLFNDGTIEYYPVDDYQEGVLIIGGKKYYTGTSNHCR